MSCIASAQATPPAGLWLRPKSAMSPCSLCYFTASLLLGSVRQDWDSSRLQDRQCTYSVDCVWKVMVHAQKPDFVFPRNGRVHLNWRGRQFGRLLAAEVCASAVVMLDTPCSEVMWKYWLPTPFASFPFTSPPVRHHVPLGFKCILTQRSVRVNIAAVESKSILSVCL